MKSSLSYILQIFTGGFYEEEVEYDEIRDRLLPLLGRLDIKAVIIGWRINPNLYRSVKSLLSLYNIPMYLWMPVFSEIGDVKQGHPVVLHSGQKAMPSYLNDGEGFEFLCPTSRKNIENVKSVYMEHFASANFDGIFLDRIRYPSFSNGYENIFSCFCPRCTKLMKAEGLSVEWYKNRIMQAKENKEQLFASSTKAGFKHKFADEQWRRFFDFKHKCVTDSISVLAEYFRNMGKKVGFDVFAPTIADFIGQDIIKLSAIADFIKPMMYYNTFAPAGINYEKAIFDMAFTGNNIETNNNDYDNLKDISSLREFAKKSSCEIYPGFEVNRITKIAETTKEYIEAQLKEYESIDEISTVVLSWNLLNMPSEYLKYIIDRSEV